MISHGIFSLLKFQLLLKIFMLLFPCLLSIQSRFTWLTLIVTIGNLILVRLRVIHDTWILLLKQCALKTGQLHGSFVPIRTLPQQIKSFFTNFLFLTSSSRKPYLHFSCSFFSQSIKTITKETKTNKKSYLVSFSVFGGTGQGSLLQVASFGRGCFDRSHLLSAARRFERLS